jgi:hypothetical protein
MKNDCGIVLISNTEVSYGPVRRIMGSYRAADTGRGAPQGASSRAALAKPTGRTQWRVVDSTHRRALARPAGAISTIPNLPPSFPEVGRRRGDGVNPPRTGPRPQGTRRPGPQRMLHRWHLCGSKKGGQGWERPSGAKVRRSWQWQTALVFLSPYASQVLARMK